ncbi:tRNA adenosine(34) deaminase TadA [Hahella chejuensis]|nr:tRNA adenosine(34) deaminase TadA [Hahella chejuensis]
MQDGFDSLPGQPDEDEYWMRRALGLAAQALAYDEVPVGAILVRDGQVLGEGWNQPIRSHDPTAHAEISAIRKASAVAGNYRLPGSTLYVTLEPCVMCLGALVHARVSRLVFGAYEHKAGAVCSSSRLLDEHNFNWKLEWSGGVLEQPCSQLLSGFFQRRRSEAKDERRKQQPSS